MKINSKTELKAPLYLIGEDELFDFAETHQLDLKPSGVHFEIPSLGLSYQAEHFSDAVTYRRVSA